MKIKICILLTVAAFLSSCNAHYYSLQTIGAAKSTDVRILKVEDSGIVVIPEQYKKELTPEIVREYSRFIPYDSLLHIVRTPTKGARSNTTAIVGGALSGLLFGILDAQSYYANHPDLYGGTALSAITGAIIGGATGFVFNALIHPREEELIHTDINILKKKIRKSEGLGE
jgi:hypothetical protein